MLRFFYIKTSQDTDTNTSESLRRDASIDNNIAAIDTRMPEFDFAQLEKQLSNAAAERNRQQRRVRDSARSLLLGSF